MVEGTLILFFPSFFDLIWPYNMLVVDDVGYIYLSVHEPNRQIVPNSLSTVRKRCERLCWYLKNTSARWEVVTPGCLSGSGLALGASRNKVRAIRPRLSSRSHIYKRCLLLAFVIFCTLIFCQSSICPVHLETSFPTHSSI